MLIKGKSDRAVVTLIASLTGIRSDKLITALVNYYCDDHSSRHAAILAGCDPRDLRRARDKVDHAAERIDKIVEIEIMKFRCGLR